MSYLPRDGEPATRGRRSGRVRNTSRARLGRFFGATTLGTLVPGLGLTLTGRRRSGAALIVLFLGGLAALAVLLVRNGVVRTALQLAVRPNVLVAASVAVVVGAVIWCASIVWTARGARPEHLSRGQRWATSAFTVLMCLLVLAPTAQVVRYVAIQRDVIGSLFSSGKHVAPSAAGLNQAHPNSAMADPWAGTPRVNVLLLGSDAGADRTGVRGQLRSQFQRQGLQALPPRPFPVGEHVVVDLPEQPLDERRDHGSLVGEVGVDRVRGDPDAGGDAPHRGGVRAALVQQGQGGVEDLVLGQRPPPTSPTAGDRTLHRAPSSAISERGTVFVRRADPVHRIGLAEPVEAVSE